MAWGLETSNTPEKMFGGVMKKARVVEVILNIKKNKKARNLIQKLFIIYPFQILVHPTFYTLSNTMLLHEVKEHNISLQLVI